MARFVSRRDCAAGVIAFMLHGAGLVAQSSHAASGAQPPAGASFRGGPAHSGVYSAVGGTIVGMQWRFLTDGDVISSPAVVNDVVYVGSGDGHLYALDRATGTQRWSFDAGAPIASSPAVTRGVVIAGSYDGRFFAVDARTGVERWRLSTGATAPLPWGHESGDHYTSSPAVLGDDVVFGAGDGNVYAVNASTGRVRWRARTNGRVRSSAASPDGSVFVGSFDGRVYAFDLATGRERWHFDTDGATLDSRNFGYDRRSIQSSPAVANGVVFVGARDGFVYAIGAADGKLRWRFDHKISWINSSPAVAGGVVYDGSSDAHFVQAVDASTGGELWRANLTATVWSSPSVAGNWLIVGDGAGRLHLFDRVTGRERQTFYAGAGVFSSPVVSGNLVFFGSNDGGVYALRLGDDAPVERAVYLDSAYVRADAAGRSVDIATYLMHRKYAVLGPATIDSFVQARISDRHPSVIVFATDHVPSSMSSGSPRESPLRRYLDAGGKIVWTGIPPLLWSLDAKESAPGLDQYHWDAPGQLLGVDHDASIFDARLVRTNSIGLTWGLPRVWRSSWGVQPAGVTQVLGADDWGLAAGWVKRFGGPEGTGFVRVPGDDMLAIYLAAEFRPAR